MISSRWISPPATWKAKNPSSHSTSKTANSVINIEISFVSSVLPPVKLDGWKHRTHEGDFNVYNAICGFACTVAARIFRLPRCGWADSPIADHSGDFFGDSLL